MPQFGHQDGFDTVSYITGPAHVLLGVRFSATPAPFALHMRPQQRTCCGLDALDAELIRAAIVAGVADAAGGLHVAEAFYVESDSPRYDLYRECARQLASRRTGAAG